MMLEAALISSTHHMDDVRGKGYRPAPIIWMMLEDETRPPSHHMDDVRGFFNHTNPIIWMMLEAKKGAIGPSYG